jgi:hypothetical protein
VGPRAARSLTRWAQDSPLAKPPLDASLHFGHVFTDHMLQARRTAALPVSKRAAHRGQLLTRKSASADRSLRRPQAEWTRADGWSAPRITPLRPFSVHPAAQARFAA